jgi:hypothetical protein
VLREHTFNGQIDTRWLTGVLGKKNNRNLSINFLNSRAAAITFMIGIEISRMIKSGRHSWASDIASMPLEASAHNL